MMPPIQFPALSHLDLSVNQLTEIPSGLPDTLTILKLGFNSLAQFEMNSMLLQELKGVDYHCLLIGLVNLNILCNCVDELNDLSQKTPRLKTLIASHNVLRTFSKSLPLSIEWVDVGFNDIMQFDEPLLQYQHLAHPFPIPPSFVDFVLASKEFFPLVTGSAAKYFAEEVGYSETIGIRKDMEDALIAKRHRSTRSSMDMEAATRRTQLRGICGARSMKSGSISSTTFTQCSGTSSSSCSGRGCPTAQSSHWR
jgi:Leucine-rich repeat (LRR) protein